MLPLPGPIYRHLTRDRRQPPREYIKGGLIFIEGGPFAGHEVRPATLRDRWRLGWAVILAWLDRTFP